VNANVISYVVSALFLGSNWYATRICLQGYKPMTAAALRFTLASLVFVVVLLMGMVKSKPTKSEFRWLALSGVLNAVQYTLFYFALQSISGGLAAVIYGTVQLFVALVSIIARTEKIKPIQIAGGLISAAGLAFIYWDRLNLSDSQAKGVVLMLAAVLVSAVSTVIIKVKGRGVSPILTTAIFLGMSAILIGIGAGIKEGSAFHFPESYKPTLALAYLGFIGSAAGFGVYFAMMKRVTVMTASSIAFVLPIVALTIDWIANEPLRMTGNAYFGVALTLAGVVLPFAYNLRAARAQPPPVKA